MTQTLLTTRQVRDLLGVNASTISRMAGDGRLPAVRVGRQWRFPADAIQALLAAAGTSRAVPRTPAVDGAVQARRPIAQGSPTLPSAPATAALEAVAPALGVTMVVTDLGGRPLTPVVNPAPAIAARLDDPAFLSGCTAEWRTFADDPELAPRFRPGRYGFLCAHSLVRHGSSLVAMVLAGGIAADRDDAAGRTDAGLFSLPPDRLAVVLATLPRAAALLSSLVVPGPGVPAS